MRRNRSLGRWGPSISLRVRWLFNGVPLYKHSDPSNRMMRWLSSCSMSWITQQTVWKREHALQRQRQVCFPKESDKVLSTWYDIFDHDKFTKIGIWIQIGYISSRSPRMGEISMLLSAHQSHSSVRNQKKYTDDLYRELVGWEEESRTTAKHQIEKKKIIRWRITLMDTCGLSSFIISSIAENKKAW